MSSTVMHQGGSSAKKHDWAMFAAGLCVLLMGCIVLFWPGLSLFAIAIMAGIMLVVAGISDIYAYSKVRGMAGGAGWVLATGICDILLGAMFLIWPVASAVMLPWIAGIFVITYSVFFIIASIAMHGALSGWGWVLTTGIVGLLCGIMFIAAPGTFPIFLGIFLIMRGTTIAIDGIVAPNALDF